jgi:hypothetical protein
MMSQQDGEPLRPDLVTGVTAIEKAAQGGHGFQTVGLDLGVLGGRNNVDDEIRRHGSSSSGISGGGSASSASSSSHNTQHSSGSRTGGSSGYSFSSSSNSNTNNDDQYEDEEEYDEEQYDNEQSHGGGGGGGASRNSQTYSYSYSSNNKNDPQFQHYRRTRDVNGFDKGKSLCESAHCVNLRCVVGPLDKNTGALIALRTRLVAHTLAKVRLLEPVRTLNIFLKC